MTCDIDERLCDCLSHGKGLKCEIVGNLSWSLLEGGQGGRPGGEPRPTDFFTSLVRPNAEKFVYIPESDIRVL